MPAGPYFHVLTGKKRHSSADVTQTEEITEEARRTQSMYAMKYNASADDGTQDSVPTTQENEQNNVVEKSENPIQNREDNTLPATADVTNQQSASDKPDTPLLTPLSEPVPSDWVVIEDSFVFFTATLLSHLDANTIVHPEGHFGEGVIQLAMMRSGATRMDLFEMLGNAAEPIDHGPKLEKIKVKAFRLEPLTDKGILTVDGERVDYGPIQAQILPAASRVMLLPQAARS